MPSGPEPSGTDASDESDQATEGEFQPEEGEESPQQQAVNTDKLLDRLLYCGKLPRYAFPTRCGDLPCVRHRPLDTIPADHAVRTPTGTFGRALPVRPGQTGVDIW